MRYPPASALPMSRVFLSVITSVLIIFASSGCVPVLDAISSEPIRPDPGKRSFGAYWDDKNLRTIVAVNIKKAHPLLKNTNINIYSYNAVVLLTGEVANIEVRELAGKTARDVHRVRQVYNELVVGPKRTFSTNTKDLLLSTKIKTKLLAYTDIDSSRVEVFVDNKTVYLMGLLTRAQTEKITRVVQRQKGVKKVIRAIEYIDDV